MVIGFILISTAPAKEHDVFKSLMNVPEIVELHPLFGEYRSDSQDRGKGFQHFRPDSGRKGKINTRGHRYKDPDRD